jgi:hypothetical protein
MEHNSNTTVKAGSERNFGIVFGVLFAVLSFISISAGNKIAIFLFSCTAVFFFLTALLRPLWLKTPNLLWFKFGVFLGCIIAPVVMALIFVTVFFPIGLIMRVIGYDPLNRKINTASSSYWVQRKIQMQSMKRQF